MKTTNRTRIISLAAGIALIWCSAANLDAQDTNVDWANASDEQVILQAIEQTTPVLSNDVPVFATYYSAQHSPISAQPWPPFPADVNNLNAWDLGSNVWLLDDLGFDYDAASAQTSQPMMAMAMDSDGIIPPGGGETNSIIPADTPVMFNPGTNLWIAQETVSSNIFFGILSNTLPDVEYQLLSAISLDSTQWISQGFVVGSETTNWTAWSLPYCPTNNFLLNALSWQDDSGTSIPDWWWLKYFGQDTNVDAYADPTGDGYTLYQD